MEQMARPGLKWKSLPEGWTAGEAAGMRVANFTLAGANGTGGAELGVIPLPGTGGGDLELVNLWRSQLSLAPITDGDLKAHTEEAAIGGQTIRLFQIVGSSEADTAAASGNQIVVAAIRKDGFTWFFKLAGDAASVRLHRDRLKSFLGEVEFTAPQPVAAPAGAPMMAAGGAGPGGRPGAGAADAGPGGAQPQPKWEVPAGWQSVPATQMIMAKWSYTDPKGGKADVTVSVFPGETGGLTANLNRWRAQVGLQPAAPEELQKFADNTEVLGGKATLVDFTGSNPESGDENRIVAAIVKRDGHSFFYKILGPKKVVDTQRDAFVKFVQTVKYTPGQ